MKIKNTILPAIIDMNLIAINDSNEIEKMMNAIKQVGGFCLANISYDTRNIFDISKDFFSKNNKSVRQDIAAKGYYRGVIKLGNAKMRDAKNTDFKESFVWGIKENMDNFSYLSTEKATLFNEKPSLSGTNKWPSVNNGNVLNMKAVCLEYINFIQKITLLLLKPIVIELMKENIDLNGLLDKFKSPMTRATLIRYPQCQRYTQNSSDQFGVAEHTDFGLMTILKQDNVGGLQLKLKDGTWIDVLPINDLFIVNIGSLLEKWSNGVCRAVPHRVLTQTKNERYSIAVFVDSDIDATYNNISTGEHVLSNFSNSLKV